MHDDLKILNFCNADCSDIERSDEFFNAFVDLINCCRRSYNLYLDD